MRKHRATTIVEQLPVSAASASKTLSDRDTNKPSDRDTYSETDANSSTVSDRDTYSLSDINEKHIIYDTEEEEESTQQQCKRVKRKTVSPVFTSKTQTNRLKNIKTNLYLLADKKLPSDKKSNIPAEEFQEFEKFGAARPSTPGFASAYEMDRLEYRNISMSDKSQHTVTSADAHEKSIINLRKDKSPARIQINVTSPRADNLELPANPNMLDVPLRIQTSTPDRQDYNAQEILSLIQKGNIKVINKQLIIGHLTYQLTDGSLASLKQNSPAPMDIDIMKSPTDFIVTRKTTKIASLLQRTNENPTKVQNKFFPLDTESEIHKKAANTKKNSNQDAAAAVTASTPTATAPTPSTSKAGTSFTNKNKNNEQTILQKKISNKYKNPPLVLKGVSTSHEKLIEDIRRFIKNDFYIKYAAKSTLLYISDPTEYKSYKNKLTEDENIEFHTYTSGADKTHAFVLRGMQGNPPCSEIREHLEENQGITIKQIYQMKTKFKPLYLIITDKDTTLKDLQNKVKYVMYTKVEWELRKNEREITQCRRCQAWGHAASNCYRQPKCMKCAGDHLTFNCSKPENAPVRCINCNGNHTSSNLECEVYKFRLKQIRDQKNKETNAIATKYVDAPLPENVWDKRMGQQTQTSTQPLQDPHAEVTPTRQVQIQRSASTQRPVNTDQGMVAAGNTNEFHQLIREFNILNNKINIKNMLAAIKQLNNIIKDIEDPIEMISVFQDFATNILPNFNILNAK